MSITNTVFLHGCEPELIEKLGTLYPSGTYEESDRFRWFSVAILEMNLELNWFAG